MHKEIIDKAGEIIKQNSVYGGNSGFGMCTLSLIDAEGYPTMSIITPSKSEGIQWITFGTMLDGNRAKRVADCNRASICFGSDEYCVNLVGEMEVITALDSKREMWYEGLKMHFSGPDDPNYCVLRFTTNRYKLFIGYEEAAGTL